MFAQIKTPGTSFFFAPEQELPVANPIPPKIVADESDDDATIGGSASSVVGTRGKRTRKRSDKEDTPGMCGESGMCQWGYVN